MLVKVVPPTLDHMGNQACLGYKVPLVYVVLKGQEEIQALGAHLAPQGHQGYLDLEVRLASKERKENQLSVEDQKWQGTKVTLVLRGSQVWQELQARMEYQVYQAYQALRETMGLASQVKGGYQDFLVKRAMMVQLDHEELGCQDFLGPVDFLEIKEWMGYQGNKASVELKESPCLVLSLGHTVHRDFLELPDSQALRELGASLGFQASLALTEAKESLEVQG